MFSIFLLADYHLNFDIGQMTCLYIFLFIRHWYTQICSNLIIFDAENQSLILSNLNIKCLISRESVNRKVFIHLSLLNMRSIICIP